MKSGGPVRVALVGCGRIAHVHASYLRSIPGVHLVGACDASPEAREAFTRRWGLPTCASLREMQAALEPDVVHVLTPPNTHATLAIELMRAGLDVLVEKPMATSVREADAMIATANQLGRVLSVDHNRWFDPVVLQARQCIRDGALGKLVAVELFAAFGEGEAGEIQEWKQSLPGGPIFDVLPHPAYLAHGFLGQPQRVAALHGFREDGVVTELRAVLEGESVLGTLCLSSGARPFANTVTLYGTERTAFVNLNNMTLILRRSPKLPKPLAKVLPNLDEAYQLCAATAKNTLAFLAGRQRYYPGIGVHLRAFYEAYRRGQKPPVSPEDGRAVVRLMEELLSPLSATRAGSLPPEAVA
ncbi:MAG: Gfo/Idh/MocA family oxidoreductase [Candidatus Binatia bacterium]|nr:Gfo/Idh/MocA family oxidoreductase [Candidatus Binatia bacterium]